MCLIVDVNVAPNIFKNNHPDFRPVHRALFSPTKAFSKLVIGGQLTDEYSRMTTIWQTVGVLDRAGRVRKVDDESVRNETKSLVEMDACRSDDHHVIALARVGEVRLLCTRDQKLMQDFKDKDLITNPRGRVYTKARHCSLIGQCCTCSGSSGRA